VLLNKLFPNRSIKIDPEDFKDRCGPKVLVARPGEMTPVQQLFDECHFPWQESYQKLLDDFNSPNCGELARETDKPCIKCTVGAARIVLWPYHVKSTRDLPPTYFSGRIEPEYYHPLDNLKFARDQFAERLSSTKIAIQASNTIGCGWTSGPSNLHLTIFPYELSCEPEKTTRRLYYRNRSSRICSISTYTGFRQKLSSQELEWLHNSQRIIERPNQIKASNFREIWSNTPIRAERFQREPPETDIPVYESISVSNDGKALIACSQNLTVIPTERITHLAIHTLLPARGGPETWLTLLAVSRHIETTNEEFWIELFCDTATSDFMELSKKLAKAIEKPIRRLEPQYNC